jgi:hypothetical protein
MVSGLCVWTLKQLLDIVMNCRQIAAHLDGTKEIKCVKGVGLPDCTCFIGSGGK